MKQILHKMISINQISASQWNIVCQEFSQSLYLCVIPDLQIIQILKNSIEIPLSQITYFRTLKVNDKFKALSLIIKLILALVNGEVSVEKGFGINKAMLFENMQELPLISCRKLKDFLVFQDPTPNGVEISPSLIQSVESGQEM